MAGSACSDGDVFHVKSHDLKVYCASAVLHLKALTVILDRSYFFWVGDSTNQFSGVSVSVPSRNGVVYASSLYCENSLSPSVRSTPETTLARRLSKRLGCPVYFSLSVHGATLDNWDLVDPISQKTISQQVEGELLDRFGEMLRVHQPS